MIFQVILCYALQCGAPEDELPGLARRAGGVLCRECCEDDFCNRMNCTTTNILDTDIIGINAIILQHFLLRRFWLDVVTRFPIIKYRLV